MTTAIHRQVEAARNGELPRVIARMKSGWAVLGATQITHGYALLLPDPVVPDLNALTERINYEILGNVEPALHAHVIPRHASEDSELRRKPVWLHDWSAAPAFSDALVPLARRIAGRLSPRPGQE